MLCPLPVGTRQTRRLILAEKKLKRMNRKDLLEILVEQSKENDQLKEQLKAAKFELSDRKLRLEKAGSIAEAAIQVNGVFAAAQKAAEQYLENVRELSGRQKQICRQMEEESASRADTLVAQAEQRCREMEAATAQKCAAMLQKAERESRQMLEAARNAVNNVLSNYSGAQEQDTPPTKD